jgi:hypothetical protein
MGRRTYKGISFKEDFYQEKPDFEKWANEQQVFKDMKPSVRKIEIDKAYKIATDGNVPNSNKKSGTSNTDKSK